MLPILVNCFQDFIPVIHSMPLLDSQSFDCMLSTLRSIDLVISFFVYGTEKGTTETQPSLWDQNILSVSLKKLLAMFPLNPVHHLSEKVRLYFHVFLYDFVMLGRIEGDFFILEKKKTFVEIYKDNFLLPCSTILPIFFSLLYQHMRII